ncbi:MAG: AMP-binding protein, partial [Verrucomicrobia bacterium]|nr:AMP-binding protein [Verrucomicrobiota bacterium]
MSDRASDQANIAEILRAQAHARPDAPALIDRNRVLTFAQLDRAAGQAAAFLLANGLQKGDAVLVLQPMSAELYVALLALFRLGLTAMFLDPSAGRDHVERCCARVPPAAFLGSPRAHLLRLRCPALRRVPRQFVLGGRLPGFAVALANADRLAPVNDIAPCADDAPALLTFTSGSTGEPKAAVRTHGFLRAQHAALARGIALAPGQVDLTTLPIFVLANLGSGVTSVLPDADLRRPGSVRAAP